MLCPIRNGRAPLPRLRRAFSAPADRPRAAETGVDIRAVGSLGNRPRDRRLSGSVLVRTCPIDSSGNHLWTGCADWFLPDVAGRFDRPRLDGGRYYDRIQAQIRT